MSTLKYISLGHRCHISQILQLKKLRTEAFPFDSIIYSFEGVIDCFQNNFDNFFPKKIICEYIFVGKTHPEADENGNRKLFRGKYCSFTHHNLNDTIIIDAFKRRIQRLTNYLSVTDDEVIFLRTVMDDNEIDMLNKFINTIQHIYPKLKFKLFLIYDNKNMSEIILKYNDFVYIVNSVMITSNQNNKTKPTSYYYLFNYLLNITKLSDITIYDEYDKYGKIFKNDSYKGYAVTNLLPYDLNN
jgi:hypothetical protein